MSTKGDQHRFRRLWASLLAIVLAVNPVLETASTGGMVYAADTEQILGITKDGNAGESTDSEDALAQDSSVDNAAYIEPIPEVLYVDTTDEETAPAEPSDEEVRTDTASEGTQSVLPVQEEASNGEPVQEAGEDVPPAWESGSYEPPAEDGAAPAQTAIIESKQDEADSTGTAYIVPVQEEGASPEATDTEPVQEEGESPEATDTELVQEEGSSPETTDTEPVKEETASPEASVTEPAQGEADSTGTATIEPVQEEAASPEASVTEPAQGEADSTGTATIEPVQEEAASPEASVIEPAQGEADSTGTAIIEPVLEETAKEDAGDTAQSSGEADNETADPDETAAEGTDQAAAQAPETGDGTDADEKLLADAAAQVEESVKEASKDEQEVDDGQIEADTKTGQNGAEAIRPKEEDPAQAKAADLGVSTELTVEPVYSEMIPQPTVVEEGKVNAEAADSAKETVETAADQEKAAPETAKEETKSAEEKEPAQAAPVSLTKVALLSIQDNIAKPAESTQTPKVSAAADTQETPKVGAGNKDEGKKDETKKDEKRVSALQELIMDKLLALTDTENKEKEIVIEIDSANNYEGSMEIKADANVKKFLADDFILKIISKDTIDKANPNAQYKGGGKGLAFFDGDVTFDGINVLMQGISMAAKRVLTVKTGKLTYLGNPKDETLTLKIGNKGSADIQMFDGKDTVDVTMGAGAKEVSISSGKGNDKVKVVATTGNVTVNGDEGNDKIEAQLLGAAGKAVIHGDAGVDSIQVAVANAAGTDIYGDAGDDRIEVDAQYGAANLNIYGGADDDTVSIRKSDAVVNDNNTSSVKIDLGEGADRLNVDLSTAYTFGLIEADGGNDSENGGKDTAGDRLHLTGILDTTLDADSRLKWADGSKNIIQASVFGTKYGYTQTVTETVKQAVDNLLMGHQSIKIKGINTFENLTDELFNKKTVSFRQAAAAGRFDDFTSYIMDDYRLTGSGANQTMVINGISLAPGVGSGLTLADVVVDQGRDPYENVAYIELGDVNLSDMNLRIKGEDITFRGTTVARNILANAGDNFGLYDHKLSTKDLKSAVESIGEMILDMVNIYAEAEVKVENGARLIAKNDVDLKAAIDQKGEIFALLKLFNPVNVKIGTANVYVKNGAEIWAGYQKSGDKIEEAGNKNGNVSLSASVKADLESGYGLAATSPVAVSVAVQNARVHINNGAIVNATRNISLDTRNEAKAKAASRSGLGGIPLAIAVNVLYGNSTALADGNLTAGRNISINATGVETGETTAIQEEGITSGGYVAVQVAKQNIQAEVGSTAVLNAGGGLFMTSEAKDTLTTKANAAAGFKPKPTSTEKKVQMGFSILGNAWNTISPAIKESLGSKGEEKSDAEKAMEALDKKMKTVGGSDYTIQVADDSETNGDVDIKTVENPNGSGNIAEVYVKPWEGYTVQRVYYRCLDNEKGAADTYTIKQATYNKDKKCWNFLQTNKEIYVYVEYKEKSGSKEEERDEIPDDIDDSHSINSVEKVGDQHEDLPDDIDTSHSINGDNDDENDPNREIEVDDDDIWKDNPSHSINEVDEEGEEDDLFQDKKEESDMNVEELIRDSTDGAGSEEDNDKEDKKDNNNDDNKNNDNNNDSGENEDEKKEEDKNVTFAIIKNDEYMDDDGYYGAILTKKFKIVRINDELVGKSVTEAKVGDEVVFVVNTRDGFKLAENGLSVSYYVKNDKGEKEEKTVVLEKNSKGQYFFKVPEEILIGEYTNGDKKDSFQVKSVFEKGAGNNKKENTSATQLSGAVAVTVLDLDNTAAINAYSHVTTAGDISVNALDEVAVVNEADGTAISKEAASGKGKAEEKKKDAVEYKTVDDMYIVPANEYAVSLARVEGGTVVKEQPGPYYYVFTPQQGGKNVTSKVKAVMSYSLAGVPIKEELKMDDDGKYRVDLTAYPIDKGANVVFSFSYDEPARNDKGEMEVQEGKFFAHPIKVSYNAIKLSEEEDPYNISCRKIGEVYHVRTEEITDKDGKTDVKYIFKIVTDEKNGYTVNREVNEKGKTDSKSIYVTYGSGNGEESKPLTQDANSNYYYFLESDLTGLGNKGETITLHVNFKEDTRKLEVMDLTQGRTAAKYDEEAKGGKVSISKSNAKKGDEVVVTLTADDKHKANHIQIYYLEHENKYWTWKDINVDEEGKAKFIMPWTDGELLVDGIFSEKTIKLMKGVSASDKVIYPALDKLYAAGDAVALTLDEDAVKEGYKISSVTIDYINRDGETVSGHKLEKKDGKYILPMDMDSGKNGQVRLNVDTAEKAIKLSDAEVTKEHGKLSFDIARADKGEKVPVKVEPEKGYILKQGTGKVNISAGGKNWQVTLKRQDGGGYAFMLPAGIDQDVIRNETLKITLDGEFEKGYDDPDQYETSLGASVAVTVVGIDNFAEIRGGTISANGVTVNTKTTDTVTTTAKAGFSKAATGISGGIGVQVISTENKARIRNKNTNITTGKLVATTMGNYTYSLTGDASGNGAATDTGVGSGIAVAVSNVETVSAIEDGIALKYKNGKNLSEVTVTTRSTLKDKVTAKAGAEGNGAGVPVLAVDVATTQTKAYLGNLKVGTGENKATQALAVAAKEDDKDCVAITATYRGTHVISADASATGGKTAVGAAIGVSVVLADTNAVLAQSIHTPGKITIKSDSQVSVTQTATAGASGGKKGSAKSDGSKGSTDKQTDNILGGVSRIASKNGNSKGMKDAKNRQQAQTSEGSVAGAGSVVVNVVSHKSRAEIADGASITGRAALTVSSINRTEAVIKANSSTTKSDTGVGVGVAVNVVSLENLALIGSGKLELSKLDLTAQLPKPMSETKKVIKPLTVRSRDQMADQLAACIGDTINGWIAELSPGIAKEGVVGNLASSITYSVVNYLLEKSGLKALLGTGSFDQKREKLETLFNAKLARLKGLPERLVEPLKDVFLELEAFKDFDTDKVLRLIRMAVHEQTVQLPQLLSSTIKSLGSGILDTLIDTAMEALNEKLKGNEISAEKLKAKFEKKMENAVNAYVQKFSEKIIEDVILKVSAEVPAFSRKNIDLVQARIRQYMDGGDEKFSLKQEFIETFRTEILDYTGLAMKITATDWKSELKDLLVGMLKAAGVASENATLDYLVGKLDLSLGMAEDMGNKHVISTQAISGVGAKSTGVAGSVAITVLNATTKAELRQGDRIDSTGDIVVDATEARRVTNVASASTDGKGDANQNKEAADKDANDTQGSGDEDIRAINNNVSIHVGVGLDVAQDGDNKDKIYLDTLKGYEISTDEDFKPTYTFQDRNGDEHSGTLEIKKDGNRYYIDLSKVYDDIGKAEDDINKKASEPLSQEELEKSKAEAKKSYAVTIAAKAKEKLYRILEVNAETYDLTENTSNNDGTMEKKKVQKEIPSNAVTLSVEGRPKKSGITKPDPKKEQDEFVEARGGDKVLVTIDKKQIPEGYVVDEIRYLAGTDYVTVMTQKSSTANQIVYEFIMPDDMDLKSVDVWFVKGDTESDNAQNDSKDEKGNTVGVGASFSMIYGDSEVIARTSDRNLVGANLTITANSDHREVVNAVAGTDPLAGTADNKDNPTKDIGVDAAIALNILDNTVKVAKGTEGEVEQFVQSSSPKVGAEKEQIPGVNFGNTMLKATENSVTRTTASGFAVGEETAVGAAVAVNISQTDVNVDLNNGLSSEGKIEIGAVSYSEDYTSALATAMGADVQRTINKVTGAVDQGVKKTQSALDGSLFDDIAKEKTKKDAPNGNNKTASMINNRLNKDNEKKSDGQKGGEASNSLPFSTNILRNQKVEVPDSSTEDSELGEVASDIKDVTGKDLSGDMQQKEEKKSFQLAAAIGVTVANHHADLHLRGYVFSGKETSIHAENRANFATLGTGAAMSGAEGASSVAAAVAVSVSNNTAQAEIHKNVVAQDGDLDITSRLTQNLDGEFLNKLAAQSIAGAVSGKNSDESIAGAVSVVVSNAKSRVDVESGTSLDTNKRGLRGDKINVQATDKSKIGLRAGGISVSKGSSKGMGLSAGVLVANNTVEATIGDNIYISGSEFNLSAEKEKVTKADYVFPLSWKNLVSDSSGYTDAQRENVKTGIIDIHKGKDDKNYSIKLKLGSNDVLKALEVLNGLAYTNYYNEAVGGSVMRGTDGTGTSIGGSVAVTVFSNKVTASMGNNARVNIHKSDQAAGNMTIKADSQANTRQIMGGISAGSASNSAGVTIGVIVDGDEVKAATGQDAQIITDGNFSQTATSTSDIQTFAAAAGIAAGRSAKKSLAGTLNVIITRNKSLVDTGNKGFVRAEGAVTLASKSTKDLLLVQGGLAVGTKGDAAGATIGVVVDKTQAETKVGAGRALTGKDDVKVSSDVTEDMISAMLAASGAMDGSSGAGAIAALVVKSSALVDIGTKTKLTSTEGSVKVTTDSDARLINAMLSAAGGKKTAVGAAVGVNVIARKSRIHFAGNDTLSKEADIFAARDVISRAGATDTTISLGFAASGSIVGKAVTGTFQVSVGGSEVKNEIGETLLDAKGKPVLDENGNEKNNKALNIEAKNGDVSFKTTYDETLVTAAGSIAMANQDKAMGATIVTVVKNNKIFTNLGRSKVTSFGNKGVDVIADAKETQFVGAAGIVLSGDTSLNGTVAVLVNNNKVKADASQADIEAKGSPEEKAVVPIYDRLYELYDNGTDRYYRDPVTGKISLVKYLPITLAKAQELQGKGKDIYHYNGSSYIKIGSSQPLTEEKVTKPAKNGVINIKAIDDTKQVLLAGGLSFGLGSAYGATVTTLVSNKKVEAKGGSLHAYKDVNVSATNKDDIIELAVNVGVSGGGNAAQIGAAVQVLKSNAIASVAGKVISDTGSVNLKSMNDTHLYNIGVAAAGAIGGAAVTPVGVVTYFQGRSEARMHKTSSAEAQKGDVNVTADSVKDINAYAAGAAVGSSAGISGTANVLVSKDETNALVDEGAAVVKAANLNLTAKSNYKLRSASVALAGAGGAAVAVNAAVSVLKSKTVAQMAGKANTSGKVNVRSKGDRDIASVIAAVAGGASAGVGVNVLVMVAGTKMSQDAADMLRYGNSNDKEDAEKSDEEASKDKKGNRKSNVTFDAKALMGNAAGSQYFMTDDEDPSRNVDGDVLAKDLEGNGYHESTESNVGGTATDDGKKHGTFDGSSGYRSKELDKGGDYDKKDKARGENMEAKDTEDITKAKSMGDYSKVYENSEPDDAVIAKITRTAEVDASGVTVEAVQPVKADMIGATLGVGGGAGVAITTVVAMMRSNVLATSEGRITRADKEGVTVKASSMTGEVDQDSEAKERDKSAEWLFEDKDTAKDKDGNTKKKNDNSAAMDGTVDKQNGGIRAIGVSLGAGSAAGIAVGVSVLLTDNVTQALLGGKVDETSKVAVISSHIYRNVLSATGAASVSGGVSANASVAVAQANGNVRSAILRKAEIKSKGDIDIYSNSEVGVNSLAVTAGVGLAASVNAGVGLAFNRMKQETGILAGSHVAAEGNVKVQGQSVTKANSYLLGVSVGSTAIALNAAVSDVKAKVHTFIGEKTLNKSDISAEEWEKMTEEEKEAWEKEAEKRSHPAVVTAGGDIVVQNDAYSSAVPKVLSLSVGFGTLGGNVLLSFNRTISAAVVSNTKLSGNNVKVAVDMEGVAQSKMAAAVVGGVAAGLSVNYVDIQAYNQAVIDTDGGEVLVNGNLEVRTGTGREDNNNTTKAEAETLSAAIGFATGGLNVAIARNHTQNYAAIKGMHALSVNGELRMYAKGNASANATLQNYAMSAGNAATTTVVALNDADSLTHVNLAKGIETVDGKQVEVDGKPVVTKPAIFVKGKAAFNAEMQGGTTAKAHSGGGTLVNLALTIAMAYGRTRSIVNVGMDSGSRFMGGIESTNTGINIVNADISNSTGAAIGATAMFGAAYSQDLFSTIIKLASDNDYVKGDVNIHTNYRVLSNARVSPSAGGVNFSLGTLALNVAMAKNTAYAGALFNTVHGKTTIEGNVDVKARGSALTNANIIPTELASVNIVEVAANIANSDLSMTQAATMRVGGNVEVTGNVDVQSIVNGAGLDLTEMKRDFLRVKHEEEIVETGESIETTYYSPTCEKNFWGVVTSYNENQISRKETYEVWDYKNLERRKETRVYKQPVEKTKAWTGYYTGVRFIGFEYLDHIEKVVIEKFSNVDEMSRSDLDRFITIPNEDVLKKGDAAALASIGTSGKKNGSGVKISAAHLETSEAIAKQNMGSTAAVLGGAVDVKEEIAKVDEGHFERKQEWGYDFSEIAGYGVVSKADADKYSKMIFQVLTSDFAKAAAKTLGINLDWNPSVSISVLPKELFTDVDYLTNLNKLLEADNGKEEKDKRLAKVVPVHPLVVDKTGTYYDTSVTIRMDYLDKQTGKVYVSEIPSDIKEALSDKNRLLRLPKLLLVLGRNYQYAEGSMPVYQYAKQDIDVWIPNVKDQLVKNEIFEPWRNHLKAATLNVVSGNEKNGRTSATARTDGSKDVGLVTAGNLDAKSNTSDRFYAMFEGMSADITGKASLKAETNTESKAIGTSPGSITVAKATLTTANANIGTKADKETAAVIFGAGAVMDAESLEMNTVNYGKATARIDKGNSYSLGAVQKSSQPTESWYETLVTIGKNAKITTRKGITINSKNVPGAESVVDAGSIGFAFNAADMQGKNTITQVNNIDIGDGVTIRDTGKPLQYVMLDGREGTMEGGISFTTDTSTDAKAGTRLNGGGLLDKTAGVARNTITRISRINVGKGVLIESAGELLMDNTSGASDAILTSVEVDSNGAVAFGKGKAYTDVTSDNEIIIAEGTDLKADGKVTLKSLATSQTTEKETFEFFGIKLEKVPFGIQTKAKVDSAGAGVTPNATAKTTLKFTSYVGLNRDDKNTVSLVRKAPKYETLYLWDEELGSYTEQYFWNAIAANEKEKDEEKKTPIYVKVGDSYEKVSNLDDLFRETTNKVSVTSKNDDVVLTATNHNLKVNTDGNSQGAGIGGVGNGTAWIDSSLQNTVWLDKADVTSGKGITIRSDNGRDSGRSYQRANAYSKLTSTGTAEATAKISGNQINQVRSNDKSLVGLNAPKGTIVHIASNPTDDPDAAMNQDVQAQAKGIKVWFVKLTKTKQKSILSWNVLYRCDFCDVGKASNVSLTENEDLSERYERAYKDAMDIVDTVEGMTERAASDIATSVGWSLEGTGNSIGGLPIVSFTINGGGSSSDTVDTTSAKSEYGVYTRDEREDDETEKKRKEEESKLSDPVKTLSVEDEIVRSLGSTGWVDKASYDKEVNLAANEIFVLALQTILTKDVLFGKERLVNYRLWTNTATQKDVVMLPNATKLYTKGSRLDFVSEAMRARVLGDEEEYNVNILTALSENAFGEPLIPVGSTGSLDLASGTLSLPDQAEYQLYLHEVSGTWLVKQLDDGFFRRIGGDQEELTAFVLSGEKDAPTGEVLEGVTADGEEDGRKKYWIGDTPETAKDDNDTLVFLLVDDKTNEVDAFRTSKAMIEAKEEPVDVSLFLYRDSKADRQGEEKYNVMFFDTPEGEKSQVMVVTDILEDREPDLPKKLAIELRSFDVENADLPAYSLGDIFYVMNDGTDGEVSLFDGFYEAAIDADTFESDYVRIEGITNGDLSITVKADQPIWAEWTGKDTAEDLNGISYRLENGEWEEAASETEDTEETQTEEEETEEESQAEPETERA